MFGDEIKAKIKDILSSEFGFDIYIVMNRGDIPVKRLVLEEGSPYTGEGFKTKIRQGIVNSIEDKYLNENAIYVSGDDLANEQERFYVIEQCEEYRPFSYLSMPDEEMTSFSIEEKENADAVLFKFILQRNGNIKNFWAYQKIQPMYIPNKKKKYFQLMAKSVESPDVFCELPAQMFMISHNVDLLIVDDAIITDKIRFMERHLGLETFIRSSAKRAVALIEQMKLVANEDILEKYVFRSNKRYAKKLMQIHKYPVSEMSKESLLEKLHTVERWKHIFEIQEDQLHLRNYGDIDNLIDLFTERFTRSDVTNQEYDTEVKVKAEQIL